MCSLGVCFVTHVCNVTADALVWTSWEIGREKRRITLEVEKGSAYVSTKSEQKQIIIGVF